MVNYPGVYDGCPAVYGPIVSTDNEKLHLKISEALRLAGKLSLDIGALKLVQGDKERQWVGVIENGKVVFDKDKHQIYANKPGEWKKILTDKIQSMIADHLLK